MRCKSKKANGQPCQAKALPGDTRCFAHSPRAAQARQAGRQKGGESRSKPRAALPGVTDDAPLATVGEVTALLAATINQTRRGEIAVRVANAVGYLSATLIKALEIAEFEKQLAELRRQIEGLK